MDVGQCPGWGYFQVAHTDILKLGVAFLFLCSPVSAPKTEGKEARRSSAPRVCPRSPPQEQEGSGSGTGPAQPTLGVGECTPLPVLGGIRHSWNVVPPCVVSLGLCTPQPVTFWILGGVERPGEVGMGKIPTAARLHPMVVGGGGRGSTRISTHHQGPQLQCLQHLLRAG